MSTISGVSSTSSAWSQAGSARASSRADRMFAKVDSDGSGSVDSTELQSMLDDIAKKTGTSLGSADDVMKKLDTDGDGKLSKTELDSGMKSLMPPPSSTVDFAQHSGGGGGGGMPPPPPPDDASSSTSSSSSTSTDPLDTNGDGVVSAQERAAGELNEAIKSLFKAADTDGDHSLSASETDSLKQKMEQVVQGLGGSSDASSSSSTSQSDSSSGSSSSTSGFDLASFINLVIKQYGQSDASLGSASASALSLTA